MMQCVSAKPTDQCHGWECRVTGGSCMFLIPDSKACAEIYGEGPDSDRRKCEDCNDFFRNEEGKRCCKIEGHLGVVQTESGIELVQTPLIDDGVVSCGGWKGNEPNKDTPCSCQDAN